MKSQQAVFNKNCFDIKVQHTDETIHHSYADENMHLAIQEAPETFIQSGMLCINLKINGHLVKGIISIIWSLVDKINVYCITKAWVLFTDIL